MMARSGLREAILETHLHVEKAWGLSTDLHVRRLALVRGSNMD